MMRCCPSAPAAAAAAQAATATATKSSAVVSLVAHQPQRLSIACRAASASSSRPIATQGEGDDSSLRNRRAMLAQGASLAAATLAFAPVFAASADDGVVAVAEAAAPVAPSAAPAPAAAPAALDVEFATLSDKTLAYSFRYPVSVAKTAGSAALPPSSPSSAAAAPPPTVLRLSLVPSRKPERYSSAAPLSPDARQRIVAELVDLQQSVTVSVTVGPPATTAMLLPLEERQRVARGEASASASSSDPSSWSPRAVAEAVLVDRSTARTTSGQRLALNSVERAEAITKGGGGGGGSGGDRYFLYEHLAQGSPSERSVGAKSGAKETYRHAWASTGVRYSGSGKGKEGGSDKGGAPFLYTLNLSCPQDLWPLLGDAFRAAAESFELDAEPGAGFVSPDSQPWRFF